jgi:peptidoglycan hydrolase-like protein with peptidoglycan-binding domain
MDLKALIAKMDQIESKQFLTEAEKKETTWTDKGGKKHPATQVKGDKYTGKEADAGDPGRKSDKDGNKSKYKKYAVPDVNESSMFKGSIANALLREFGLEERVPLPGATPAVKNPYQGADAAKFAAMSPADQAWLTKGGGQPDINDEFILARAPNKGKPAPQKVDPNQADNDDAAMGAAMTANAQAAKEKEYGASADQADADMGAAMTANAATAATATQAATQAANGVNAAGQNVTMPNGINPETGEKTTTTAGAAPGAADQMATPGAGAAKPAAGGNVLNVQKQLAALGIDPGPADGKMGNKTIAGIKAFEKMAGKPETGKITPEFEQLLAKGAQIKSQSNLVASLGAMEKILTKYKVESVTSVSDFDIMTESEIKSYVMKNLGRLDGSEQMQFMQAMLSEAPLALPGPGGNRLPAVSGAPAGNPNVIDVPFRDVTPTKPGIGSKIADFGRKVLNKGVGKVAAAGAAIAAGGYAAYQGLAKMLADPAIQMSPADKAEFEKHLAVIGTYTKDAEAGAALPKDVQQRLSALNQRLTKIAGKVQAAPGAAPAAPGAAPAAPAAPGAAPAQGGTTNTTTNTSVQGELKMGKPSGPITFNGKVVQPGAPEYAAASAALIKAQGGARDFRSRNDQNVEKNLATSGAPVSQGAANADRRDF